MSSKHTQSEEQIDGYGYEMLLAGNEEILKGSDTGTLIAFAAIAYQEIRGGTLPHQAVGCGLLVFSVFMCAIVHLIIGNAYIRRAKALFLKRDELRQLLLNRRINITLAWVAVAIQFAATMLGTALALIDKPPALIKQYFLDLLG